jgi:hypothetical protein
VDGRQEQCYHGIYSNIKLAQNSVQAQEFSANGKPAAKKWFKGVKSVETKLNGRIGTDIILLKAYK